MVVIHNLSTQRHTLLWPTPIWQDWKPSTKAAWEISWLWTWLKVIELHWDLRWTRLLGIGISWMKKIGTRRLLPGESTTTSNSVLNSLLIARLSDRPSLKPLTWPFRFQFPSFLLTVSCFSHLSSSTDLELSQTSNLVRFERWRQLSLLRFQKSFRQKNRFLRKRWFRFKHGLLSFVFWYH